jgi:cell division protein FtsQ
MLTRGGFNRRPNRTRLERAALERRERAAAHLAQVRGRPTPRRAGGGRTAPVAIALAAFSLAAGLLAAERVSTAVARWSSGALAAIHVQGAERLAPAQIAAATGVPPGSPLAAIDPRAVAARVAEQAWVASARAVRLPTGALLVSVREREPAAIAASGAQHFAVDAAGLVIAPVAPGSEPQLPRLAAAAALAPGEADPELARAAELAGAIAAHGLPAPERIEVPAEGDPDGFALRLPGLAARFVLGREDLEPRLERLAQLLAQPPPELAAAASVDLRFADQAVLRREPSPSGTAQAAAPRGRAEPSERRPAG